MWSSALRSCLKRIRCVWNSGCATDGTDAQQTAHANLRTAQRSADFNQQTNENKIMGKTTAAVKSRDTNRWIATEWERCHRTWGNPQCPCLHSDPVLPDCGAGETVRVAGRLWFPQDGNRDAV